MMQNIERLGAGVVQNVDRAGYLEHLARQSKKEADDKALALLFERMNAMEEKVNALEKEVSSLKTSKGKK